MPVTKAYKQIERSLSKQYLNKRVPKQYQSRYGKTYDRKDIRSFSYAVARSRGISIERKR